MRGGPKAAINTALIMEKWREVCPRAKSLLAGTNMTVLLPQIRSAKWMSPHVVRNEILTVYDI